MGGHGGARGTRVSPAQPCQRWAHTCASGAPTPLPAAPYTRVCEAHMWCPSLPPPFPRRGVGGGECDHGKKLGWKRLSSMGALFCAAAAGPQHNPPPPHPATPRGLGGRTVAPGRGAQRRTEQRKAGRRRAKPRGCGTPCDIPALRDVTRSCAVTQCHATTYEAPRCTGTRRGRGGARSIRALLCVRVSPWHSAPVLLFRVLPFCPRVAPHIPRVRVP